MQLAEMGCFSKAKLKELTLAPYAGQSSPQLREFLYSTVTDDGRLRLDPPAKALVFAGGVTCATLLREAPYQLEMVLIEPNVEIPEHAHPDVEFFEVGFSGAGDVRIGKWQVAFIREPRPDGTSRSLGRYVYVPAGAMHSGRAGPHGAVFLSAQRWLNGLQPTSIIDNWVDGPG